MRVLHHSFWVHFLLLVPMCQGWRMTITLLAPTSDHPSYSHQSLLPRRDSLKPSDTLQSNLSRRRLLEKSLVVATTVASVTTWTSGGSKAWAEDSVITTTVLPSSSDQQQQQLVQVVAEGDARKIFNEARALESQGNIAAAQRLYTKVTKISPRFIYGWSNLGNTQTAFGDLTAGDESYSTAIDLCNESIDTVPEGFGKPRCNDLYLLLLNRGSLRLNNNREKDALQDLQRALVLRGRPDALILQNLARAKELNGYYGQADKDYNGAIAMTANEVNPFWLRSAMVKLQLGDLQGGFDLLKRVENRFPDAPEVRAAYASFLAASGKQIEAQQKFLQIPDRQRIKYSDKTYLTKTVAWPPAMLDAMSKVTAAVGDSTS